MVSSCRIKMYLGEFLNRADGVDLLLSCVRHGGGSSETDVRIDYGIETTIYNEDADVHIYMHP